VGGIAAIQGKRAEAVDDRIVMAHLVAARGLHSAVIRTAIGYGTIVGGIARRLENDEASPCVTGDSMSRPNTL
jgi:hypothetical protein